MKLTTAALLALVLSAVPVFAQPKAVTVYVTSDGASDGFTDPNKANQDTMNDLRKSLKGKKAITVVDSREAAQIVLVVMDRTRAQMTASVFGDNNLREVVVRVKFLYKDVETEMSGTGMGGAMMTAGAWKQAAGKVAKQVEQWIEANKTKL